MGIFLMHLSAEVALITKYEQNVFYIAFWIQTKKLHQLNHMLLFFGGELEAEALFIGTILWHVTDVKCQ